MTDIELVELAAKAAGIKYDPKSAKPNPVSGVWFGLWLVFDREPSEYDRRRWNPLFDDGDALRLAVKLDMDMEQYAGEVARIIYEISGHAKTWDEDVTEKQDIYAATRRAIVRAAAEIGRTM